MTFLPVHTRDDCPRAYDGCTCMCHRTPGAKHVMPCCGPGTPRERLAHQETPVDPPWKDGERWRMVDGTKVYRTLADYYDC